MPPSVRGEALLLGSALQSATTWGITAAFTASTGLLSASVTSS